MIFKHTHKKLGTVIIRAAFFLMLILLISFVFLILLTQCNGKKARPKVSDDASSLSKIVDLNLRYTTARWEIYGFPEQSDSQLAIGPTDDMILIAELAPLAPEAFRSLPTGEVVTIKVGAGRPWLQREFRTMFEIGERSSFDLSGHSNCRPLAATLRKSNRAINGILCKSGEKAAILLILSTKT